jgi:hypothetical protein
MKAEKMTSDEVLRQRIITLATNLLEATKAGKISWALTDAEGKFVYAGSRSSVTIEMHTDRFEGDATILSILNDRGTTVDSLQSEATQSEDGWIPAPWNDLLEDHSTVQVSSHPLIA